MFTLSNSASSVYAQILNDTIDAIVNDTIYIESPDSITDATLILNKEDTLALKKAMAEAPSFKPNPKRAVIYSAIFPGLGQIYNKKYWKLPIIYGGFIGLAYAISWNNKTYQDYKEAYVDYYDDKYGVPKVPPADWKKSWEAYVPIGTTPQDAIKDSRFEDFLKRGTTSYRRYRDLSIILTAALYFLCMADSYVDAQLFDFDITPDLSMRIEPVVTPRIKNSPDLYGINCCIKF